VIKDTYLRELRYGPDLFEVVDLLALLHSLDRAKSVRRAPLEPHCPRCAMSQSLFTLPYVHVFRISSSGLLLCVVLEDLDIEAEVFEEVVNVGDIHLQPCRRL